MARDNGVSNSLKISVRGTEKKATSIFTRNAAADEAVLVAANERLRRGSWIGNSFYTEDQLRRGSVAQVGFFEAFHSRNLRGNNGRNMSMLMSATMDLRAEGDAWRNSREPSSLFLRAVNKQEDN